MNHQDTIPQEYQSRSWSLHAKEGEKNYLKGQYWYYL